MATHITVSRSVHRPEKLNTAKGFGKAMIFALVGGALGLFYAAAMYGLPGPGLFLGAGTGVFLALAYYLIEFVLNTSTDYTSAKGFIIGVLCYTPVIAVGIFTLLVMSDISLALEEYGTIADMPLSFGMLPVVLLFSFFASFAFLAGRVWLGRR